MTPKTKVYRFIYSIPYIIKMKYDWDIRRLCSSSIALVLLRHTMLQRQKEFDVMKPKTHKYPEGCAP